MLLFTTWRAVCYDFGMISRSLLVLFCSQLVVFGQFSGTQFDIQSLTPQQRMLAQDYLNQPAQKSSPVVTRQSQLDPNIFSNNDQKQPTPEVTKKTAASSNEAPSQSPLDLSVIEEAYHDVDIDHSVTIMHGVTKNQTPVLKQFGYDFFDHMDSTHRNTVVPKSYQLQGGLHYLIHLWKKRTGVGVDT